MMSFSLIGRVVLYCVVVLTLFVLGCTGGDTASGASDRGVIITDFAFDTSQVYHDEEINLRMVLENQGQKNVTDDTYVFIYGQSISDYEKQWRLIEGSIDVYPGIMSGINDVWTVSPGDFLPPQPEMNLPGGIATFEAMLQAPVLDEGETTSYTFYTRVCYPYETSMLSIITSSSREEMRISQGTSAAEVRNTAGPVHINLGGMSSIVARGSSMPVIFEVTDVGGGFSTSLADACDKTPASMNRGKVDVSIEVESISLDGATRTLYGSEIKTPDCTKTVKLINGVAEVRCSIPIDKNQPVREYHIRAIANYNYYVGADTKITVDYIAE